MTRHTLSLAAALLLAGTACSAQQRSDFPNAQGMTDEGPHQRGGALAGGPQGPVVAGSDRPLPKDAPAEPGIRNVPATTGRGNVATVPPPAEVAEIGRFEAPFAMAILPPGGLLVTEKAGHLKLRYAAGSVVDVTGVPAVAQGGQGGLLGVAVAPDFASSHAIYLSFAEPRPKGSALALARAILVLGQGEARLDGLRVIWRAGSDGPGGQFGAKIAFSPDGRYLFLTSGERQRFTPAQDPNQLLGKIVRLTLDGEAAPGNPFASEGGWRAQIWTSGHRNPYGLLFTPDGRLWEEEMGPQGGDELNLIEPGRNYGWPIVSNGDNYSGQPIPDHPSRPDLAAPALWWNPSISPGGMLYYTGAMFPQLRGSLLIAALSAEGVARVTLDGASARPAEFWDMGTRIRDVAQAPDGAIWLLEDGGKGAGGRLLRLTPKK
jgi:glucose/arabinose dehydrogenase